MSMRFALLLSVLPLLALAGCSSSSSSTSPPCEGNPDQRGCLTDHYFHGYAPEQMAQCTNFPLTKMKVDGQREITFFLGTGTVVDDSARSEGQFLQRFYEPYGLTFFTQQAAQYSGITYALNATADQLDAIGRNAGVMPGQNPTPDQQAAIEKATGDLIFADLRNFIRAQSNPPRKSINVVVLDHIASPAVSAQFTGGVIAGLGLSPTLFKNIAAGDPSKNLFDLIGLGEDFTPTLFVGHADVVQLATSPDVIVSHEMGHAMGLQHTQELGNLMTQYSASGTCLPGLTDKEIAVLKSTASLLLVTCGWERLFELRNAVVRAVLARR